MQDVDPLLAAFDRLVAREDSKVVIATAQARVSAAPLDNLSRAAGQVLAAARLRPDSPVGLVGPNGSGFLAGLIACRRAGHPTALLDGRSTGVEIDDIAVRLDLAGVLHVREAFPRGPAAFCLTHSRNRAAGSDPGSMVAGAAIIKLTSGTAGRPRGVATSSEALLADDAALRFAMKIGAGDRLIAMVPFAHSYGLSSLVVPALVHGMTLVVPETSGPLAPLAAADRCGATILPTIPAWIAALQRLAEPPSLPPTVRLVISAGAPLQPQTASEYRRRFGARVHVFYGTSESGGITYDRTGDAGERGTVGEPLPGVRVTLEKAGTNGSSAGGRVVVASPSVALSYVPDSDCLLSGRRFVSQDLAQWRGAELEILGRLDDMINVRGSMVNPAEVERIIAGLPGVHGVFVHAPQRTPAGDPYLMAVVAGTDRALTPEAVVAWCRARLSDHKVPRQILLVPELPLTARGKVDRAALSGPGTAPASPDA